MGSDVRESDEEALINPVYVYEVFVPAVACVLCDDTTTQLEDSDKDVSLPVLALTTCHRFRASFRMEWYCTIE